MASRATENATAAAAIAVLCANRARYLSTKSVTKKSKAEKGLVKRSVQWADVVKDVMLLDCLAFTPAVLGVGRLVVGRKRLERWWRKIYDRFSPTEVFRLYFIFTVVYYFTLGGFSFLLDCIKPRAFRRRWKYQEEETFDAKKLPKLLAFLSLNIAGPLTYGIAAIALRRGLSERLGGLMWEGLVKAENMKFTTSLYKVERDLPSFFEVCKQSVVFLGVYEVGSYYTHRMLHWPFFYKRFHKIHHEWTSPIAIAAAYAHPLEYAISNVAPALVTSALLRPHILSLSMYSALGMTITLAIHCGYGILGPQWWQHHDLHHEFFRWNYGFLTVMDKIHGTDRDQLTTGSNL